MAAANTDKFKKVSRRWVGQIGAGGVADGTTTTIPLSSATNLPTGTGVVVVIDRVNSSGVATSSSEETVIGVVSGSNLVSCVRGAEGTAQAHSAGAVVEVLITAQGWNDLVDGIVQDHSQLGYHTDGLTKIRNTSDATKILKWDISGATTGKTMTVASSHSADRTLTLPNATDTLVGKATTDTLTNKTINTASNVITTVLGYAEVTATQGSITSEADLTGLTVTVTMPAGGGRVKVTGYIPSLSGTSGDRNVLRIKESTTVLQSAYLTVPANNGINGFIMWSGTPSAGSHTYKLTLQRDTGSGNSGIYASATEPAFILVETI